jgi:hypothetical protein
MSAIKGQNGHRQSVSPCPLLTQSRHSGLRGFTRTQNESIYVPATHWHRLENPGKVSLEVIEVQIGSYLAEDDIVRSDDIYSRSPEETS